MKKKAAESDPNTSTTINRKKIFVIHGRNEKVAADLYKLLTAVGLEPKHWNEAVKDTGKGAPYTMDAVDKGIEAAVAVVALWTGDDLARLRPELTAKGSKPEVETPQIRPNVILETGYALAKNRDNVIIVQVGELREVSDLRGLHVVNLHDTEDKLDQKGREALIQRLKDAGAEVNDSGNGVRWKSVGRFTSSLKAKLEEAIRELVPPKPTPPPQPDLTVTGIQIHTYGLINKATYLLSFALSNYLQKPIWRVRLRVTYFNNSGSIGSRIVTLGSETDREPILPPRHVITYLSGPLGYKKHLQVGQRFVSQPTTELPGIATRAEVAVEDFDVVGTLPR